MKTTALLGSNAVKLTFDADESVPYIIDGSNRQPNGALWGEEVLNVADDSRVFIVSPSLARIAALPS
jgi:hypothetical protein